MVTITDGEEFEQRGQGVQGVQGVQEKIPSNVFLLDLIDLVVKFDLDV
jgi:hypothetical protein